MNMNMLFTTLSEIELEIDRSESVDDVQVLNLLDERYEATWQEILDYQPVSVQAQEELVSYLLDKLCAVAKDGGNVSAIRDKLMSMFQVRPGFVSQYNKAPLIGEANPNHA